MGKRFEKFILHIGSDKTGSTSIQQSLSTHRNKLLRASEFLYPLSGWHATLGSCFSSNPQEYVLNRDMGIEHTKKIKARDKSYLRESENALDLAKNAKSIIVSYEGFIDADSSVLKGLRDYCLSFADELVVIVYLRPPISYALSAMSQNVKSGRRPFPAGTAPYTPYAERLKQIVSIFGKDRVKVNKFDRKSLLDGNIVDDFLDYCGV